MVKKFSRQQLNERVKQIKTKLSHPKLNAAITLLGIFFTVIIALRILERYDYIALPQIALQVISLTSFIITVYLIATICIRLTVNYIANTFGSVVDIESKLILTKVYAAIIYIIATAIVLWRLGVSGDNIALFAGFVATGLALALREVIISYIIWFILLTKKPFRIGDYIKIGDDIGLVKHIGTFYVLIDSSPSSFEDVIRIPNKTFLDKPIYNYGRHTIPVTFKFPLENTKNFENKLSRIKDALQKIGVQQTLHVEPTEKGINILLTYQTSLDTRASLQTKITNIFLQELR